MATQDTPETARDARLEARVSAAQKSLLQQAVALSGLRVGLDEWRAGPSLTGCHLPA